MSKQYAITQEVFDTLPQEEKEYIKNMLKAFDEVPVTYENGKYSHILGIKKNYAEDHKFIGIAYIDDFYSIDERMENYKQEFGYPWRPNPSWVEKQRQMEQGKVFIR